jgi:hypothetical protein
MSRESRTQEVSARSTRLASARGAQTPFINRSSTPALLQRAYADPSSLTAQDVKHLQRTVGNRATIDILSRHTGLQAKLKLGPVGDSYEQEADQVAAQVVRQMDRPAPVQRMDEEEELAQLKPMAEGNAPLQRSHQPLVMGSFARALQESMAQPRPLANDISRVQRAPTVRFTKERFAQRQNAEEELQMKPQPAQASDPLQRVAEPFKNPGFVRPDAATPPQARVLFQDMSSIQRSPDSLPAKGFTLQRQEEEEEELQMKPLHGPEAGEVEQSVEQQIQAARGGGQLLDDNVRGSMEQGFGADFSNVRIHTGSQADTLNRSLNARAFTTGNNIFFRSGEYNPGSSSGQQLLAHELTHTVQQGEGVIRTPQQQEQLRSSSSSLSGSVIQRVRWKQVAYGRYVKVDDYEEPIAEQTPEQTPKPAQPPLAKQTLKDFEDDAEVTKEFVTEEHKEAISAYCKKMNVILSVRDTGSLSLDRVNEGAKPKPHTILEKSIKESSLKKFHPEAAEALQKGSLKLPDINGVNLSDLKGFVGHWDPETGELLGVRVDKKDVLKETEREAPKPGDKHSAGLRKLQPFLVDKETNAPYIPMSNFAAFCVALPGGEWKQFLYTGDYDLHEVYKHNKTLVEGSIEKARLLTGINKQIARNQKEREEKGATPRPLRKGSLHVEKKSVQIKDQTNSKRERKVSADTIHGGSPYAMIQHGDQMGYITNQIHEGRLNDETRNNKAQMVEAVAQESPSALAWCVRGKWYVTRNPEEHSHFRSLVKVTVSSGWLPKYQKKMRDGTSRTSELSTRTPAKITSGDEERRRGWKREQEQIKRRQDEWEKAEESEKAKQPYMYRIAM